MAHPTLNRTWRPACLVVAAALGCLDAQAATEEELQAAFVYRFAQYTLWPQAPDAALTVCTVRAGETEAALRAWEGRKVAGVPLRVQRVDTPEEAVRRCQVLVTGQPDAGSLRRWLAGLGRASVLVVGLRPEAFRMGATIVLQSEPQGLVFSVNQTEAQRRGLQVSAHVLKLAQEVR